MSTEDVWSGLETKARGPLGPDEWQGWRELLTRAIRAALPPTASLREARALGTAVAALLARHPEQAPRIVTWLREQPRNSRRCVEAILEAVLAARPPLSAVAGLLDLFETRVRWPDVAQAVSGRAPHELQPVLDRLRTGSPPVRRAAIRTLALYPGDLEGARAALRQALQDAEPGVVGRAALVLAQAGPLTPEEVEALEEAARRPGLRAFAREAVRAALALERRFDGPRGIHMEENSSERGRWER